MYYPYGYAMRTAALVLESLLPTHCGSTAGFPCCSKLLLVVKNLAEQKWRTLGYMHSPQ